MNTAVCPDLKEADVSDADADGDDGNGGEEEEDRPREEGGRA